MDKDGSDKSGKTVCCSLMHRRSLRRLELQMSVQWAAELGHLSVQNWNTEEPCYNNSICLLKFCHQKEIATIKNPKI